MPSTCHQLWLCYFFSQPIKLNFMWFKKNLWLIRFFYQLKKKVYKESNQIFKLRLMTLIENISRQIGLYDFWCDFVKTLNPLCLPFDLLTLLYANTEDRTRLKSGTINTKLYILFFCSINFYGAKWILVIHPRSIKSSSRSFFEEKTTNH